MALAPLPPSRLRAGLLPALACCALLAVGSSGPAAPAADPLAAFVARATSAWATRDVAAWMALWDLPDAGTRAVEEEQARAAFEADQTQVELLRPPRERANGTARLDVQVFVAREPRARIAYWRLTAARRDGRWALVAREDGGQVDGLVHLSLGREAWRARGVSLRLEDFELRMEDGTLYASGQALGPTALVFVGRGRVRVTPRPRSEREQLRRFAGQPTLDAAVGWAFVRLHPGDFERVLETKGLVPERQPEARRAEAERVFRAQAERSYLLDAALPRSPWWLLPGLGDAVVDFPFSGRRVLTFAISGGDAEDVNLFDRDGRRQLCVYPSASRSVHYDEDAGRSLDVLDQELAVRFEPEQKQLQAAHTMRVRSLSGGPTLRLRLDQDFKVSSVATADGTSLLYFRVRGQDSLVVSLGGLAERGQPFTLVTRYSGRHDPEPVDQEVIQSGPHLTEADPTETWVDEPPLVYANRTYWYPRPTTDDFSPTSAVFDTPEGWLALTGGELVSQRTEAKRTRAEYRLQQPGKFVTAIVGRFRDVGMRQEGEQVVRGFALARSRRLVTEQVQVAQQMLAFYAGLFGPCPYPQLGLAITETRLPGGHSPPGLLYVQLRPPMLRGRDLVDDPANFGDLRGFFLAHEAAHQWWGQATAPANYRERWLSEGWAQYAAALWIRHDAGEAAFRGMMGRMGRWATKYDGAGAIHLGQRVGMLDSDPRVYRAVVYDKGAWVLHMLRGLLGDDAFFRGARTFLDRHRFGKAGSEDLRRALEEAGGMDLRPYFERWVYDTGLPRLRYTARNETAPGGGFRTTVEVRPEGLPGRVPLEIALVLGARREARTFALEPAGGSFVLESAERPRRVDLNEDRGLLARVERVGSLPTRAQR